MISCPSLPFPQRIEDCFRWHIHTYSYIPLHTVQRSVIGLRVESECLSLSVSYLVVRRVSLHSCWLRLKFIATHKIEAVTPCKSWIKAALIFDHWRIKGDADTYTSADWSSHDCGKKGCKCKYKNIRNNADITLDPFFCTHWLLSRMNMFFADILTKGKSHTHKWSDWLFVWVLLLVLLLILWPFLFTFC